MNAINTRAHCGCVFDENGALISRCAGHLCPGDIVEGRPIQRGIHLTPPVRVVEPYTQAKVDGWTLVLRWLIIVGCVAWGLWLVRVIGRVL